MTDHPVLTLLAVGAALAACIAWRLAKSIVSTVDEDPYFDEGNWQ